MQPTPTASRRSRTRRMLGLLGAAAIAALLIGSAVFVLPLVRGTRHQIITGSNNTQTHTGSAQTWQDAPTSPGIYTLVALDELHQEISKVNPITHKVLWSYPVEAGQSYSVRNNTIYVSSSTPDDAGAKFVYAINASTGKLRWRTTLAPDVEQNPVMNPATGKPMLDPRTGKPMVNVFDMGYLTQPVEADGIVYVLSRSGKLYSIYDANGTVAWMVKLNTSANVNGTLYDPSPVTVSNGIVYGAEHNLLFALDTTTHKLIWTRQINTTQFFNQIQIANETLYVSASHSSTHTSEGFTNTSSMFAFRAKDGYKQWQQDFPTWLISSPTVADGTVYVGTFSGQLSALKASDGTTLWQHDLGGRADLEQPIVDNGIIYAEEDGTPSMETTTSTGIATLSAIIALNPQGTELWRAQGETATTVISMQTVENGALYTSKFPNQIVVYAASSGKEQWHQAYGNSFTDKAGNQMGITPDVVVIP